MQPKRKAPDGGVRLRARRAARVVYRRLAVGHARRVVDSPRIQRLRLRLQTPVRAADVTEVMLVLEAAGVRAWLAGGWALDALVGRETRRHRDLDLVVQDSQLDVAVRALSAREFRTTDSPTFVPDALLPRRCVMQDAAGRIVDIHPVDCAALRGRLPAPEAEIFSAGMVAGQPIECLSADLLLAGQVAFADGSRRKRREVAALRRLAQRKADPE